MSRFNRRGRALARIRRRNARVFLAARVTVTITVDGCRIFICRFSSDGFASAERPAREVVEIEPTREALAAHGFDPDSAEYACSLEAFRRT